MSSVYSMSSGPVGRPIFEKFYGIYEARVEDTNDPLKKNRIRMKIPQVLGTALSNWAANANTFEAPKVGQAVHAMFIGGDRSRPVYFLAEVFEGLSSTVVQMFGQLGTFGPVTSLKTTASGHSFIATPVPGWLFGKGTATFYTDVMSDGQVVISSIPFTENELKPTYDHAEINIFDPGRFKFYNQVIPTSRGSLTALASGANVGGTDVGGGDLRRIISGSSERLVFTCDLYYDNWDIGVTGLYPALGFLTRNNDGDWIYNQGISLTGDQWEATNPAVFQSVISPSQSSGVNGSYWSPRFPNQMAVFPQSGNIVIGHYFNANGFNTGCISVIDPNGNLLCAYQIPSITPPTGTLTTGAVRDVESDPSSSVNDERFVIIYDGFGTNISRHPFQEFTYNASTQTITPLSVPCIPNDTGTNVGFCIIDNRGTLYVTTNIGLGAGNTSVYVKQSGNRSYVTNFPASPGWQTGPDSWGTLAAPDYSLGFPVQQGLGIFDGPLTVDPVTGSIIHPGSSGRVGIVTPNANISSFGPNLVSSADSGFETSNLLSADDSTFASGLGDWSIVIGSITRVIPPFSPPFGTEAAQLQQAFGACQAITSHLPVIASTPYQFRTYFLAQTIGRTCEAWIRWYDGSGSTIIDSPHATVTDTTTAWTVCDVSGVSSPANAAFAGLIVQIDGSAAGENHYFASNFLWNMKIGSDWSPFVTNIVRTTAAAHTGTFSMQVTAPFSNETTAVTLASIPVTPGQEYQASAWFLAGAGSPSQNCTVQIRWLDAGNNSLGQASGTLTVQDNTSTWTQGRVSGPAPVNAANANIVMENFITTANTEKHLIDDVVFQAQPFTVIPYVDLNISVLRTLYPTIVIGRGCISNRRYYVPIANTSLTSQENTELSNGTYIPGYKPQFLASVDLAKVLSR